MLKDLSFYKEVLFEFAIESIITMICFLVIPLILLLLSLIIRSWRKKAKWFLALFLCIVLLCSFETVPLLLDIQYSAITVLENADCYVTEDQLALRPSFGTWILGGNVKTYIIATADGETEKCKIYAPDIDAELIAKISENNIATIVYAKYSNRLLAIYP